MPAHKGRRHHKVKLSEDQVRQIRRWKAEGVTYLQIQERLDFLVCQGTISALLRGKTWRHVE